MAGFTNEPLLFVVSLIVYSLGVVAFHPAMAAYVGDIAGTESKMGFAYSFYNVIDQVAGTFASLIGGITASSFGLAAVFSLSSVYGFIALVIIVTMAKDEALTTIKAVDRPKQSLYDVLKKLCTNPLVWVCWSSQSMIHTAWGVITTILPIYLSGIGVSYTLIGLLFSINTFVNASTRFVVTIVSGKIKRFGWLSMMIFGLAEQALAILLFHLTTDFFVLATIMGLCGFGHGLCVPGVWVVLGMVTDKESRGSLFGILTTVNSSFTSLGKATSGGLAESYGYLSCFNFGALLSGVGGIATFIFVVISKRKEDALTKTSRK